jgi:LmbE family N-acetylglucosaminyl deacetylase
MHLFVSPHLDDAVLSCGGFIHQLRQQGESSVILTVMAGDPPDPLPDTPLVWGLHARWEVGENPVAVRRAEDQTAARILGAQAAFLSIPDCIYRTADGVALYPNGDDDIFGPIHPDDPARSALEATESAYFDQNAVLYAPLGIGCHVDHQLVREWILERSAGRTVTTRFYEDYPYCEDESATRQALDHFPIALEPELIPLAREDFTAKCTAIAAYHSQISTFWGSLDEMRDRIRQHLLKTGDGRLAERYWRPAH